MFVELDLGTPAGSEAGLRRPSRCRDIAPGLTGEPNVVRVVPLTRTIRHSSTDVDADELGSRSVQPLGRQMECNAIEHVALVVVRRP